VPVAREPPTGVFFEGRAPLSALIREGLGPLVGQSEAARRLGLTLGGVAQRIRRKEVRRLRVGRRILVPVADLRADAGRHAIRGDASAKRGKRSPARDVDLRGLATEELLALGA